MQYPVQCLNFASKIFVFKAGDKECNGLKIKKLAEGRVKEINNGRLAMLGIMGFVSSSTISRAVLILNYFPIPSYAGNFWAPFEGVVDAVSSTVS